MLWNLVTAIPTKTWCSIILAVVYLQGVPVVGAFPFLCAIEFDSEKFDFQVNSMTFGSMDQTPASDVTGVLPDTVPRRREETRGDRFYGVAVPTCRGKEKVKRDNRMVLNKCLRSSE